MVARACWSEPVMRRSGEGRVVRQQPRVAGGTSIGQGMQTLWGCAAASLLALICSVWPWGNAQASAGEAIYVVAPIGQLRVFTFA